MDISLILLTAILVVGVVYFWWHDRRNDRAKRILEDKRSFRRV
jgi:hypothetical protein